MKLTKLGLLLMIALMAEASASELNQSAFTQVPSRFTTRDLTLGSRGLGEVCYGRDLLPDGSVCNPAFLGESKESFLLGRIFLGNGYTALNTANQLLFKPLSREFLQSLFRDQSVTSLESNVGLLFQTKHFSAAFSPYRVQYFSEVHNPNYPVIAMHAAVERALTFSGGTSMEFIDESLKNFSMGVRLRLLNRDYIHSSFSLAETLTQNPQDVVPVKKQLAAYLDPTFAWRSTVRRWNLWTSVGLVNLGRANTQDPLYEDLPDVVTGFGVEPPVGFGRLRLGLDIVNLVHADEIGSMVRLGTSYQLGIMELMSGFNQNAITGGLQFGFQVLQAGIVYEFARSEVDGGFSGNKISTEISVKL